MNEKFYGNENHQNLQNKKDILDTKKDLRDLKLGIEEEKKQLNTKEYIKKIKEIAKLIPEEYLSFFFMPKINAGTEQALPDSLLLKPRKIGSGKIKMSISLATFSKTPMKNEYVYKPEHKDKPIKIIISTGDEVSTGMFDSTYFTTYDNFLKDFMNIYNRIKNEEIKDSDFTHRWEYNNEGDLERIKK